MPELPEVETVRRGLERVLVGHSLTRVEQRRADLRWPLPVRFAERLSGRRVEGLARRSKYILAALDGGETWILHLGMSGRVLVEVPEPAAANGAEMLGQFAHAAGEIGTHDHVILWTDGGARVIYNDARRFGAMDLWPTQDLTAHRWLAPLGPEPLGNAFHADYLAEKLAGRFMAIKAALLDQRIVAGLGNIYVCEALHRTGIHPARAAGAIARLRIERLVSEIRSTLTEAIEAGGSSLRDYRQADGELGYFQHSFQAYGREGEPCRRNGCKGSIRRIVQSARSSFYCARCQR